MLAARRLSRRVEREARHATLVDSPLVIEEILSSGARLRELFVAELVERFGGLIARAAAQGAPIVAVPPRVLAALADTTTPQGVVAVVDAPGASLEQAIQGATLLLVLAGVRDPGNAGTLVRSAIATGADAVVFTRGAVDALHPKTVRASGGALWRAPVVRSVEVEGCFEALITSPLALVGADARAPVALWDADLTGPVALVLGNESAGLPPEVAKHLERSYSIPMPGPAESLNVAVAGSVFLFEIARQRQAGRRDRFV